MLFLNYLSRLSQSNSDTTKYLQNWWPSNQPGTGTLKVQCVGGRRGVYWRKLNIMITIMLFVALPCSCSCPDWTNQTLSLLFSIYSGYPRGKWGRGFHSVRICSVTFFLFTWSALSCFCLSGSWSTACPTVWCLRLTIWALTRVLRGRGPIKHECLVCQWILILKTAWGLKRQLKKSCTRSQSVRHLLQHRRINVVTETTSRSPCQPESITLLESSLT